MYMSFLSNNIRYLRKAHGMSQDVLAETLGYKSYTTIQKWESGVSEPPLKIVHNLADIFHVDIDELTTIDLSSGVQHSNRNASDIAIPEAQIRAAFFNGYADDLPEEEIDALWNDAKEYAKFKALQKRKKKGNDE